jgi:hypothetical protein
MYNTGEQPKYTERKSNKNSFPLLPKLTAAHLLVKLDFHYVTLHLIAMYIMARERFVPMYILSVYPFWR